MNKKKRELEQNELADALSTRLDQIRPHIPRIAMIGGVVMLAIVAVAFWIYSLRSIDESRWREYLVSSRFADARGFEELAEIMPDTRVGQLAQVNAGDSEFSQGMLRLLENRQAWENNLKQAADKYLNAMEATESNDFIRLRAAYALAYTWEAMGRFEDAREIYQRIIDEHPESPEASLAQKSLRRVNDPELISIQTAFQNWQPEEAPGSHGVRLPPRPEITVPIPSTTEDDADSQDGGSDRSESSPAEDEGDVDAAPGDSSSPAEEKSSG